MNYKELLAKDLLSALDPFSFAEYYLEFNLEEWQKRVLRSRHRRIILNCSRQAGKSTLGAILTAHQSYYYAGSLCLLFSPSQRQSGELFRKVSDFLRRMPSPPKRIEDNKRSLQLENDSRVVSLPGDAGRIRGFTDPDLIIEDEAAQVPDELHSAVRPMLAVSNGRLILLSTPYGLAGHFYEIFNSDDDIWDRYLATGYDCSHLPQDFLDQERSKCLQWEFDQEYMCKFVGVTNQPFTFQNVVQCLTDQVDPLFRYSEEGEVVVAPKVISDVKSEKRRTLLIGVDIGKENSYTAISIVEKLGSGEDATYQLIHLDRLALGTPYPQVVEHTKHLLCSSQLLCRQILVVDKSGVGNAIVDYFRHENLKPRGILITSGKEAHGKRGGDWNVPRQDLIIQTRYLIDTDKLQIAKSIPLSLDLIEELTHFDSSRFTKRTHDTLPYSQQLSDDLAMSLMLALWYGQNGCRPFITFKSL
jgi:hypothetical protein